jgi:hypothetical protein
MKGGIHVQTHRLMKGFIKCPVEMGSGVIVHILSFINIGSDIRKFMREGFTDTQTAWQLHKPAFIPFKIRKVGL